MILLRLFYEFFKVGLFSIGGGMATIPFLLDLSQKTNWYTTAELTNMIAVGESTPGPIGINMATYVGYHIYGYIGGLISTLGLITPSIIIILIIHYSLSHFKDNKIINDVLLFIRAAAIGLIAYALYKVTALCLFNNSQLQIIPAVFLLVFSVLVFSFKKIHPIVWILLGALLGLIFL